MKKSIASCIVSIGMMVLMMAPQAHAQGSFTFAPYSGYSFNQNGSTIYTNFNAGATGLIRVANTQFGFGPDIVGGNRFDVNDSVRRNVFSLHCMAAFCVPDDDKKGTFSGSGIQVGYGPSFHSGARIAGTFKTVVQLCCGWEIVDEARMGFMLQCTGSILHSYSPGYSRSYSIGANIGVFVTIPTWDGK